MSTPGYFDSFIDRLRESGYPVQVLDQANAADIPCPLGLDHMLTFVRSDTGGLAFAPGPCRHHLDAALKAIKLSTAADTLTLLRAADDIYQVRLTEEATRQRTQRQARRMLDAEERPPFREPEILTLRERLAQPRPPVRFRIEGWQPVGSRVVLAAQFKAGKTTVTGNLARSLVDEDMWLGQFKVTPTEGTVAILDLEMSTNQMDEWLAAQGIRNSDRVIPIPMKGNAAAFDILDSVRRGWWGAKLHNLGCSYLIVDCLRPILDALGLDEQRDAGRFLVALDALMAEAEVPEGALVHHMGHAGERSRGDSRIRDWPDVEWRLVRQDDDPASPRYISAYGRDVDQSESQLEWDPATRHLTLVGGSRKDASTRAALADVLELLGREPGLSGRQIEKELKESTHTQATIRAAVKQGKKDGAIMTDDGPRGAVLHYQRVSASQRVASALTQSSECVSAFIGNALHSDTRDKPVRQRERVTGESCCEGGPVTNSCTACRWSPTYGNGG